MTDWQRHVIAARAAEMCAEDETFSAWLVTLALANAVALVLLVATAGL